MSSGAVLADVAEDLHLDGTSQLNRFLALLKLPQDIRHLVSWGKAEGAIPFTAAFELSRLTVILLTRGRKDVA